MGAYNLNFVLKYHKMWVLALNFAFLNKKIFDYFPTAQNLERDSIAPYPAPWPRRHHPCLTKCYMPIYTWRHTSDVAIHYSVSFHLTALAESKSVTDRRTTLRHHLWQ